MQSVIYSKIEQVQAKLFVCVLTHNQSDVTSLFMNSFVSNSPHQAINLIILDNNSTDQTIDILYGYVDKIANYTIIKSDKNLGVIGGRNYLFDYVFKLSGFLDESSIMFLDNDQLLQDGWYESYLSFMDKGYDIAGAEAWLMNHLYLPVCKIESEQQFFTYVGCGGMMIRAKVVKEIGFFDPVFNPCYFEDPDYNFRAIEAGFKIGWNKDSRILHLAHKTLGNLQATDRRQRFTNSWNIFSKKWEGKRISKLKNI
ncbi:MAG: glycosyltransferase [Phenylobacterium sp.]